MLEGHEYHRDSECYRRLLDGAELQALEGKTNHAAQIMIRQGETLAELAGSGRIDSYCHVALNQLIQRNYDNQGACERIENTPFPMAVDFFGRAFTWIFIDAFKGKVSLHSFNASEASIYVFIVIPFSMMISWIFFYIEKVSESLEDPFDGMPHDVPISTLVRTIETDLYEILGETTSDKKPLVTGIAF